MKRRKNPPPPPWKAAPQTAPDATLIARADWLSRAYPLLRLRLARFAWCSPGVEARARVALRDWGRGVFALFAEDARQLDVPAERYFRSLLQVVPPWTVPLLVVLARRDRRIATLLGGPRLSFALFPTDQAASLAAFDRLYGARVPLDPAAVAALVRLRAPALERAKARWQARAERPAAALPARRASPATGAAPADSATPRAAPKMVPAEALLRVFRAAQDGGDAQVDLPAIARWARHGNEDLEAAIAGLADVLSLPERPVSSLLAVLPRRPRRPATQVLRLLAAGRQGVSAEFAGMSRKRAIWALDVFEELVEGSVPGSLLAAAVPPPGTPRMRGAGAAVFARFVRRARPAAQVAAVLAYGPALRADLRAVAADHLARLADRRGSFAEFLAAAAPLQENWPRLHVELREAALAAWVKAAAADPGLRPLLVEALPALAQDAARWADDHDLIPALIAGPAPGPGFEILLGLDATQRDRIWAATRLRIRRLAGLPEPWLAAARANRHVLDLLIARELPRLACSPLEGLDLAALMDASLRNRRLAHRLAGMHDAAALAAAMPRLRRRLAGRTRRLAAAELALLLGWEHAVPLAFLATRPYAPAAKPGTRFDGLYHSWDLPKRKGGTRRITAPAPLLKAIQRRLLDVVFANVPCHRAATGFRAGVSIADNARPHVGRKVVVNVDLQGFFPNTRFKRLRRAVERVLPRRLGEEARRLVVDICAMDGGLPTGAPTSPAIANIVMTPVDRALAKVAARHGVAYTRYADDLTLSGDDPLRLLPFLRQLVGELGYSLDPKKTNIFRRGRRQVVTGLVVNDKVSVPRRLRRRLRAAVHRVALHGAAAELSWHGRPMHLGELAGHVAFLGVAHPEESRALAARVRDGLAARRRDGAKAKP
jgi:retron-type reverse transcriptase